METAFQIIIQYKQALLNGLLTTIQLCLLSWFFGIILGVILGVFSSVWSKSFGLITKSVSFLLSCVPILVILFWVHYPLQTLLNIEIDPFYSTVFCLSLVNTFFVSDVVQQGIKDLPKQYRIAAEVCGLSSKDIFIEIELPLIFRQVIPNLLTIQVNILQLTIFSSLISVEEIFRVIQRINAVEYKPVETYSTLFIFFLIICFPLNLIALQLKKKYSRDLTEK